MFVEFKPGCFENIILDRVFLPPFCVRKTYCRVGDSFLPHDHAEPCPAVADALPMAERHRFLDDSLWSRDEFDDVGDKMAPVDVAKALPHHPDDLRARIERGSDVLHTNEKI